MRFLLTLVLVAGCSNDKPAGNGRTLETCPSSIDHLGAELAGDCDRVGDSCTYGTSEWDFACSCVTTPTGSTWQCCSSDSDYLGYSADGCYSDSPVATGWPCCGSCINVPYGSQGQSCTCRNNVWLCATVSDGGTD